MWFKLHLTRDIEQAVTLDEVLPSSEPQFSHGSYGDK